VVHLWFDEIARVDQTSEKNTWVYNPKFTPLNGKKTLKDTNGNSLGFLLPTNIFLKYYAYASSEEAIHNQWVAEGLAYKYGVGIEFASPWYPLFDVVEKTYRNARIISEDASDNKGVYFFWELDNGNTIPLYTNGNKRFGGGYFYPAVGIQYNFYTNDFCLRQNFIIHDFESYVGVTIPMQNRSICGLDIVTELHLDSHDPSISLDTNLYIDGADTLYYKRKHPSVVAYSGQPYGLGSYPDISAQEELVGAYCIEANPSDLTSGYNYYNGGRTQYYADTTNRYTNIDI
jgi:hypothetical protein